MDNIEKKIEEMLLRQAEEYKCTVEEVKKILVDEYGTGGDRGYGIFTSCDLPENLTHIERIDELEVYDGDLSASMQAEKDGINLIPFELNPPKYPYNCYRFIDTEENRKILDKVSKSLNLEIPQKIISKNDVQLEALEALKKWGLNSDLEFRYMMLDRMKQDCKYYLGNGNKYAKHLWAENESEQIEIMKHLYNSFPDDQKPEWLTFEEILEFETQMVKTSLDVRIEFAKDQQLDNGIAQQKSKNVERI